MPTSSDFSTNNPVVVRTITVIENSRNNANNTSNVTVKVDYRRTSTGTVQGGTGTVLCVIDGVQYSANITSLQTPAANGNPITLFTKTLNITHGIDGSKELNISTWSTGARDWHNADEESYSLALTPTDRSSNFIIPLTSQINNPFNISINRADPSFTHKVTASFFDNDSIVISENAGTSASWTPPTSLAEKITGGVALWCNISVETIYNSASLGTRSSPITLTINPVDYPPTVELSVREATPYIANPDGSFIGDYDLRFVQGVSTIGVDIDIYTQAGASVSRVMASIDEEWLVIHYIDVTHVSGNHYRASYNFTQQMTRAGTHSVYTLAEDSRGIASSDEKEVAIKAYSPPRINSFRIFRVDASGVENDEYPNARIELDYTAVDLENGFVPTWTVKVTGVGQSSPPQIVTGSGHSVTFAQTYLGNYLDPETDYNVSLKIEDLPGMTTRADFVPSTSAILDFKANKKGMCVGGLAKDDGLAVKWKTNFESNVYRNGVFVGDYVNQSMFNGFTWEGVSIPNWKWRDWIESNIREAWASISERSVNINSLNGGWYSAVTRVNFPVNLFNPLTTDPFYANVDITGYNYYPIFCRCYEVKAGYMDVLVLAPFSGTVTIGFKINVIGRKGNGTITSV